ncbi:NAD-dependent epimerase/dehydratase family protein [Verrucomicrobia bacterium]|nr:NAD-dependent epimerase/dehydratase family protein [Verrucomicrobiota bacterium]MDA7665552.1 NAD-dependent epimerase/dehydratase family protein [Verrucomicrobiota bacterium]
MSHLTLVTGGAGFIGKHVVDQCLSRGDAVRVLDIQIPEKKVKEVEYIAGDITNLSDVQQAMKGVNKVFHLAAKAGLWSHRNSDFYRVNQMGTRYVFQEAESAGVDRIVHCSTESILKSFRRKPEFNTTNESVELTLQDMPGHYCRAKFLAEQEALTAADRGVPVVIVNPTVPIGPGDSTLTPPSRMLLGYLNGRYGAFLETHMNMVDARDVAAGHLAADEKGEPGQRYILGGTNLKLSTLLEELSKITGRLMPSRQVPYWLALCFSYFSEGLSNMTGKPPVAPITGVRLAGSPMLFDNTRAIQELGVRFRPLTESLTDEIAWFHEQGYLSWKP